MTVLCRSMQHQATPYSEVNPQIEKVKDTFETKGRVYFLVEGLRNIGGDTESELREIDSQTGKTLASIRLSYPALLAPTSEGTSFFYVHHPSRPTVDAPLYELSLNLKSKRLSHHSFAIFGVFIYANGKLCNPMSDALGNPKMIYKVTKGLFIDYENDTVDVPGPVKGIKGLGFVPWSKVALLAEGKYQPVTIYRYRYHALAEVTDRGEPYRGVLAADAHSVYVKVQVENSKEKVIRLIDGSPSSRKVLGSKWPTN